MITVVLLSWTDMPPPGTQNNRQIDEGDFTNRKQVQGQTAFSLLEEEVAATPIVTFCKELDEMLGGGVPLGTKIRVEV